MLQQGQHVWEQSLQDLLLLHELGALHGHHQPTGRQPCLQAPERWHALRTWQLSQQGCLVITHKRTGACIWVIQRCQDIYRPDSMSERTVVQQKVELVLIMFTTVVHQGKMASHTAQARSKLIWSLDWHPQQGMNTAPAMSLSNMPCSWDGGTRLFKPDIWTWVWLDFDVNLQQRLCRQGTSRATILIGQVKPRAASGSQTVSRTQVATQICR